MEKKTTAIKIKNLKEELDQVMQDLKKNNFANPFHKIVNEKEDVDKRELEIRAKQNVNEFLDKYNIKKLKD